MLLAAVIAVPVFAGSAVIGSVAGSKDATVGGQALLPSTTLFSGDSVQVKEGVAVVAMGQGSRMVFGRQTQASFLREGDGVTVMLGEGNVTMYHPTAGVGLRVKAGAVTVSPESGTASQGEVAMLNGLVQVTSKEGTLKVEGNGPAQEVAKGKTITVKAKAAAAPQGGAPAAGAPVSGMTGGEIATIAGAGAAGVGAGFSIAARSKASDAANLANQALTAAQAATAAAQAACKAASPTATCP
ncbi:MAG TPA: hypothetical protein VFM21_08105 [Terriglobia bacterium]|nr:hypothetical protein [Terriglobia bacterium]